MNNDETADITVVYRLRESYNSCMRNLLCFSLFALVCSLAVSLTKFRQKTVVVYLFFGNALILY